jgi:hypothetical protein
MEKNDFDNTTLKKCFYFYKNCRFLFEQTTIILIKISTSKNNTKFKIQPS